MKKKYELTDEIIVYDGHILHRIRALRDIPRYKVKVGDLGGYIESELNLSHNGDAWVFGDTRVFDSAWIFGDARVFDSAWVFGDARVYDDACVSQSARVFGDARVYDNSKIYGKASISGNNWIKGNAEIYGNAKIYGNADISGNAEISGDAEIFDFNHYMIIGPIGSRDGYTTFYRNKDKTIWVNCGCFNGSIDDFLKKVDKTHGNNKYAKVYHTVADLARIQIDLD